MGKAPAEMTVAVIKKELEARGLDTKGLKAVLVARLEEALAGDATGDAAPAAEPAPGQATAARRPTRGAGAVGVHPCSGPNAEHAVRPEPARPEPAEPEPNTEPEPDAAP